MFRGHPLAVAAASGAATVFYGIWPRAGRRRRMFSSAGDRHEAIRIAVHRACRVRWRSRRCARPMSRSISARKPSASRRRRSSRWSARGSSRRTARDKVIMVDGRPWVASKDNPTKLLIESARKLYGTTNEELMDNAKQFAYFPVAVLQGRRQLPERHDQREVQDRRRRGRPLLRHLFNVKPNGDWLARPLQRHREQRRAVGVPQRHPPAADVQRPRARPFMLDRAAWHELKMTVDGADFKAWLDGKLALEYTLGSAPAPAATTRRRIPICFRRTTPCCAPPVAGKVGLWSKTDTTSYFKDYVVSPKVRTATCVKAADAVALLLSRARVLCASHAAFAQSPEHVDDRRPRRPISRAPWSGRRRSR